MGDRGPVPKRSSERRRQNLDGRAQAVQVVGAVVVPACPKAAHPLARRWYLSLKRSAQSKFYEPSDWEAALVLVEQLSRLLDSDKPIAAPQFAGIWAAMGSLLTTEGDRRRVRLEVERTPAAKPEPPPGVAKLADFRRRAAG